MCSVPATFNGKPLPSGTVLFHTADGRVEHALIFEDGSYTVSDAPLGELRITVRSPRLGAARVPRAR
jgi:hypothetical protein